MRNVRAVIQPGKHAQQTEATDGAPANELDQAVGRIGVGSDEHGAAGKFAVIESKKEAARFVPVAVFVTAKAKRSPAKLGNADEYAKQISKITERLKVAIGERAHVR